MRPRFADPLEENCIRKMIRSCGMKKEGKKPQEDIFSAERIKNAALL